MAKEKEKEFKVDMKIKGVELLNGSLKLPAVPGKPIANFNFNINIESQVDNQRKLIFVIVHVEIKTEDQSVELGSLSVSCIYEIVNFEEIIKVEDGNYKFPQPLIDMLNSISISTTRGVMFSTFKGTFLHAAILPIIDPKGFKPNIPTV